MQLQQTKNARDFDKKAKDIFIDEIKQIISREGRALVAVPGGRSVVGMFKLLDPHDLDWSKVHMFLVDEKMVSLDDPQSNYKQAKELFLDRIPSIQMHPFKLEKGVYAYTKELSDLTVGENVFDVVLVSAGEDGHIGAIYPHHHSIHKTGKEYFSFEDGPKPPAHRMTMSPEMIGNSNVVILLFATLAKKVAFKNFQSHDHGAAECPAKIVMHAKKPFVVTQFKA